MVDVELHAGDILVLNRRLFEQAIHLATIFGLNWRISGSEICSPGILVFGCMADLYSVLFRLALVDGGITIH